MEKQIFTESYTELENSVVAEEWVRSIAENKTVKQTAGNKSPQQNTGFGNFVDTLSSSSLQALSNQLFISVPNTQSMDS